MTAKAPLPQRELRIAPVMTGGTSLAVWMGGATAELYRLASSGPGARAEEPGCEPIYRRLLEVTRTIAMTDVITGTSAGGLNGTLLAVATVHRAPIARFLGIRRTWLELADLEKLVRPRSETDPPSLFRGDYFLDGVHRALEDLVRVPASSTDDLQLDVDLMTTVTTVTPVRTARRDLFGEVIAEGQHAQRLRFTGAQLAGTPTSDEVPGDADLGHRRILEKLALAARTSAGIPGAFEPTFLAIDPDAADPEQLDFSAHASFTSSRWAVDGGVVVNLPLTEAIGRVYDRAAEGEVRRVFLYVNPTPAVEAVDQPSEAGRRPSLLDAAMTVVLAPRAEGVSADLDQIARWNRELEQQAQARVAAGLVGPDLPLSGEAFDQYKKVRSEAFAHRTATWMAAQRAEVAVQISGPSGEGIYARLVEDRASLFPPSLTELVQSRKEDGQPPMRWGLGIEPLDHEVSVAIGLLHRSIALAPPASGAHEALGRHLAALHKTRSQVGALQALDRRFWEAAAESAPPTDLIGHLSGWADRWPFWSEDEDLEGIARRLELAGGEGTAARLRDASSVGMARRQIFEMMRGIHYQIAQHLQAATPSLSEALDTPTAATDLALRRELAAMELVAPHPDDDPPPAPSQGHLGLRLLRIHLLLTLIRGEAPQREQRVDVVQVSSNQVARPTRLDGRTSESKLAGPELARLGAFLKPSWRANDWLWGRLDAAHRLVTLLLDPVQIQRFGTANELRRLLDGEFQAVHERTVSETAAVAQALTRPGSSLGTAASPSLDTHLLGVAVQIEHELTQLTGKEPLRDLPETTRFLAERVQLAIAREELPLVAAAIRTTRARRGAEGDGGAFYRQVLAVGKVHDAQDGTPDLSQAEDEQIVGLIDRLRIGEESLSEELSHGLGMRAVSQVASAALNVASSSTSGIPVLRKIARPLRAPIHGAALLAEWTTSTGPLKRAAAVMLAATASAIIALALLGGQVSTPVLVTAIGCIGFLLLAASLRSGMLVSGLWLAGLALVLAMTLIGADMREVLYDQPAPKAAGRLDQGAILELDEGGFVRMQVGTEESRRIQDVVVAEREQVVLRSSGATVLDPGTTEYRSATWKRVLFAGPVGIPWVNVTSIALVIAALVTLAPPGPRGRRRWVAAIVAFAAALVSPLFWRAALFGVEPEDPSGPKALVIDLAEGASRHGPLITIAAVVGTGLLLSLMLDERVARWVRRSQTTGRR